MPCAPASTPPRYHTIDSTGDSDIAADLPRNGVPLRLAEHSLVYSGSHDKSRKLPLAMDLDLEAIKARVEQLKSEHRDLDEAIASISEKAPFNQLQIQRLKKRKLVLKDLIAKLESQLVPDIIA
ncbi:MAG TPA: DUF465 domain-containing protein [Stellaceae bacterium]|nr:DUF465 domain-containing protein [Stellaceae bacterium]